MESSILRERPRYIELMIYQWLHALDKAHGVWKLGVNVERSFIDPARVDVEQMRISRATKDLYGQAARFCARRGEHVTHRGRNGIFLAITSMEASEDEKLHTSNENKMSYRWRGRTWQQVQRWKSSECGSRSGQRLAASPG